jgi:hypothetical protein
MSLPSRVNELVDDLFGRPPQAAAAEPPPAAPSSDVVERAAPLVDALFDSHE